MKLTQKDIAVIDLLIAGKVHKEIAHITNVAKETIDRRCDRMRRRNKCSTTSQLIAEYLYSKHNIKRN